MTDGPVGVIFDMDGVLIDSYQAHYRSWQIVAEERGLRYGEKEFAADFGRTGREIISERWPDLSDEQAVELHHRKERVYRELIETDFPGMDGAADLIRGLHAAGMRLAVGSSGPPENVELVLRKLGVEQQVDVRVTGKDVTRGKPDPEVFRSAAERLGVAPQRCAVIEDAPVGIRAAHAGGIKCIALVSTGRIRGELQDADLIVDSLRELSPERIRRLIG